MRTAFLRLVKFQFHSGTIKRLPLQSLPADLHSMFQFHSGTIKSSDWIQAVYAEESFNSILVRLKAPNPASCRCFTCAFQFHSGTIKSVVFF